MMTQPPESLFLHALRTEEWVPTVHDGVVQLARPDEAWTVGRYVPRRVAACLTALPSDLDRPEYATFFAAVGIVDAVRATSADLLRSLATLSAAWPNDDDGPDADGSIIEVVRWVMRELNSALEDGTAPELTSRRSS